MALGFRAGSAAEDGDRDQALTAPSCPAHLPGPPVAEPQPPAMPPPGWAGFRSECAGDGTAAGRGAGPKDPSSPSPQPKTLRASGGLGAQAHPGRPRPALRRGSRCAVTQAGCPCYRWPGHPGRCCAEQGGCLLRPQKSQWGPPRPSGWGRVLLASTSHSLGCRKLAQRPVDPQFPAVCSPAQGLQGTPGWGGPEPRGPVGHPAAFRSEGVIDGLVPSSTLSLRG